MEIMTWNTGLTEGSDAQAVINYVKPFIDQDNAVAVLQQIPYKDPHNNWTMFPTYADFMAAFPENEYTIIQNTNHNNGFARMLTVVVTRMTNVSELSTFPYKPTTNRECFFRVGDYYKLLGLHLHPDKRNADELRALNNKKDADIILGDFNAGDYYRYKDVPCENRATFKSILKDYVCICNMPTKEVKDINGKLIRRTCIDHVFVKSSIVDKCSSLKIHEDIKISDHYPITFYID